MDSQNLIKLSIAIVKFWIGLNGILTLKEGGNRKLCQQEKDLIMCNDSVL